MEETIFFNKGNAIASYIDTKALYQSAEIAGYKTEKSNKLVIVKDEKSGQYILFDMEHKADPASDKDIAEFKLIDYI